jgi:hypothetical protein
MLWLMLASAIFEWVIKGLISMFSKISRKQILQKNPSLNIVSLPPKIVLIGKDQKTGEAYIVCIEKKSEEV